MVHINKDAAGPSVELGFIHRYEGSEAAEVWGTVTIANAERLQARDLELSTLEELVLTPEGSTVFIAAGGLIVGKDIINKGVKGNYASVWIHNADGTAHSGSVDLNFHALGEG